MTSREAKAQGLLQSGDLLKETSAEWIYARRSSAQMMLFRPEQQFATLAWFCFLQPVHFPFLW